MPNGYMIPPHTHPTAETVTVKSGHFVYGMGDKVDYEGREDDEHRPERDAARQHAPLRARARDTRSSSVSGNGPFAITYVNPADDPRTKAKPKAK